MSIEVGDVIEGVVTGVANFGAFVELPDGRTGLVHISEVADTFVNDINDYVRQNDKVLVKVLSFRGDKIGLSIRQAKDGPGKPRPKKPRGRGRGSPSFEDKLARFLKESDEKQSDLRKSADSKRGGRGSRRQGF